MYICLACSAFMLCYPRFSEEENVVLKCNQRCNTFCFAYRAFVHRTSNAYRKQLFGERLPASTRWRTSRTRTIASRLARPRTTYGRASYKLRTCLSLPMGDHFAHAS
ncbi:hypothetical protein FA95DRAFT_1103983 [Auriscalpium vulgare]|uniref:Uncharacterized protein n=1 Tax=Auriscalpium vulgare TaxID=40419 RepID=A0ACB8R4T2_9AGAM|nr:hypothetical protein FA95DRAFT_1103983 [Auriscalpium vulgare]